MLGDEFLDVDNMLGEDTGGEANEQEDSSVMTSYKRRSFLRAQLANLVIVSLAYTCAVHLRAASKASFGSSHNKEKGKNEMLENENEPKELPPVDALWLYASVMTVCALLVCALVSEYFGRKQGLIYHTRLRKWHEKFDDHIKKERTASVSPPTKCSANSQSTEEMTPGTEIHAHSTASAMEKQPLADDSSEVTVTTTHSPHTEAGVVPVSDSVVLTEDSAATKALTTDTAAIGSVESEVIEVGTGEVEIFLEAPCSKVLKVESDSDTGDGKKTDIQSALISVEKSADVKIVDSSECTPDTAVEMKAVDSERKKKPVSIVHTSAAVMAVATMDDGANDTVGDLEESESGIIEEKCNDLLKAAKKRKSTFDKSKSFVSSALQWSERNQVLRVVNESANEMKSKFWDFLAASMAFSVAYGWKDAVYTLILTLHKSTAARFVSVLIFATCMVLIAMVATALMHYKTGIATRALLRNLKQTRKAIDVAPVVGHMLGQSDRGVTNAILVSNDNNYTDAFPTVGNTPPGGGRKISVIESGALAVANAMAPKTLLTLTPLPLAATHFAPSSELPLNTVTSSVSKSNSLAFFKSKQVIRRVVPFVETSLSILAAWSVRDCVLLLIDLAVGRRNNNARLWTLWLYAVLVFLLGYILSPSMALKMRRHKRETAALRKRQTALEYTISVKVSQEKAQLLAATVAEKEKQRRQSQSQRTAHESLSAAKRRIETQPQCSVTVDSDEESDSAIASVSRNESFSAIVEFKVDGSDDTCVVAEAVTTTSTHATADDSKKPDIKCDLNIGETETNAAQNDAKGKCLDEVGDDTEDVVIIEDSTDDSSAKQQQEEGFFVALDSVRSKVGYVAPPKRRTSKGGSELKTLVRSFSEIQHTPDKLLQKKKNVLLVISGALNGDSSASVCGKGKAILVRAASADTVSIDAVKLSRNCEVTEICDANDEFIAERKREIVEIKKELSAIVVKSRLWELFVASLAFNCGLAWFDAGHSTFKAAVAGSVGHFVALLCFAILMTAIAVLCTLYLDVLLLESMRLLRCFWRWDALNEEITHMTSVRHLDDSGSSLLLQKAKRYWAKLDMLRFFGRYFNAVMSLVTALSYALSFEALFLTAFSNRKNPETDAPMLWLLTFIILILSVLITFFVSRIA